MTLNDALSLNSSLHPYMVMLFSVINNIIFLISTYMMADGKK